MSPTTDLPDRALGAVATRLREIADHLDAVGSEGAGAWTAADQVAHEVEAIFAVCDLGG